MNTTQGFAYAAAAYLGACIFYLIATKCYGTPFNDTLTDHQRQIKVISARKRASAFTVGLILSIIVLAIWQPFKSTA